MVYFKGKKKTWSWFLCTGVCNNDNLKMEDFDVREKFFYRAQKSPVRGLLYFLRCFIIIELFTFDQSVMPVLHGHFHTPCCFTGFFIGDE
jgi:hypothetical protein